MADQLQLRGGTTSEHATFTGALREVTVDTDKDTVVVHDNATVGGKPLLREDLSNLPAGTIDNADINAAAAIAGTKISPNFGGQTIVTTGAYSAPLGSASTPSLTFTGDPNTGIFSPGADQVAISTNGVARLTTSTTAVSSSLAIDHPLGAVGTPSITFTGDLNTGIFSPAADTLAFVGGGAEAARIDSSGRLLVGTSTSATDNIGGTGYANIVQILGAATGAGLKVGNTADFARINLVRSASVGTDVELGTLSFGAEANSVERARVSCFSETTGGSGGRGGRLVFSTTPDGSAIPTERMRITSGGFLCVSSTGSFASTTRHNFSWNTNERFQLNHTSATATDNFGIEIIYSATPNNTGQEFLRFADNTALRATLRSNGGLANFQANDVNLSDINTKKDISLAADTWDCVKKWEIVNYRYKDQHEDADLNIGVIAQQVAESCPEVITAFQEATEDEPEKLGVKEQQMYWMAIKALQEAMERIEQLETSNIDLLARVIALETA